jgi:hypothetical protein
MPRPKRIVLLTTQPAHSAPAIEEYKTGITDFLAWANRARTGETSSPAALQAETLLTAFSQDRFNVRFVDLSGWAFVAATNIRHLVRDSHWHLRACISCDRWFLAKYEGKRLCRRPECQRADDTKYQQKRRAGRHERDQRRLDLARRQRTF